MRPNSDALRDRLHAAAALLCAWLVLTSPWIAMLRRIPSGAGWLDYAHVVTGGITLAVAVAYTITCTQGGRWRTYFPWLAADVKSLTRDVRGVFNGRLPTAEGGGLFAVIEGLLLVALSVTALTGTVWYLMHGSSAALAWRAVHGTSAHVLVGLIVVHVLAVATHLFELA